MPCTNTGVLARRPEAKYRWSPAQVRELAQMQRSIIADSIRLLKPGGAILYSTCSIEDEENRAITEWACRDGAFRPERERTQEPLSTPGGAPTAHRDGSYSVLLRPVTKR